MNNNILLTFIGILVADIVYQSGLLTKLYAKINLIEQKIMELEHKN